MFGGFFGDYLIREGIITQTDLDGAIAAQRQHNELFGHLAVSHGWIDESALDRLLTEQAEQHIRLGALAVGTGALTQQQVDELLSEQAHNHLYLGDALVRTKVLDADSLNVHLQLFRDENAEVSDLMAREVEKLDHNELVYLVLEAYRSYFFRLGYVMKVKEIQEQPAEQPPSAVPFLGTFRLRRGETVFIGPVLDEDAVIFLASGGGLLEDSEHMKKREAIEYLEQLFYGLNYQSCRQTRYGKERAHVGAIRTSLPEMDRSVEFTLIGFPEPISILYYR